MKHLIWAFISVVTLSGCQGNKQDAASTTVKVEVAADSVVTGAEGVDDAEQVTDSIGSQYADVALKFINAYTEDCDNRSNGKGIRVFISESPYVTPGFKSELKRILDEADKVDPEMGLGFDPIFDGQDYPDQGFEIKSVDEKEGYVVVRGKDWKEFTLPIKIANVNGDWLVDGSGIVNIPQDKRRKD